MSGEHERRRPSLLRPLRPRLDVRARRFRRGVYLLPSMFTMANLFCGYACIVHSMRRRIVHGGAVHRLCVRARHARRPHRPHDRNDQRLRTRVRLTRRRGVVRRRAGDPVVPVGPATARSHRLGGRLSLRGRGRGQARALQHPVGITGQALFRRHAQPGGGVHAGGDRLRLSRRDSRAPRTPWRCWPW